MAARRSQPSFASEAGAVSKCEKAESGTMVLVGEAVVVAPLEVDAAGFAEAGIAEDAAGDPVDDRAPAADAADDEGALEEATYTWLSAPGSSRNWGSTSRMT